MANEQLAERYAKRIKRCLTAMKIFLICVLAVLAVLVIFILTAGGSNMRESNPAGFQWGILIIIMLAVLCAIGIIAAILTAQITIYKFKKLGTGDPEK